MREFVITTNNMYNHPFIISNSVLKVNVNIVKIHREMKDISMAKNNSDIENSIKKIDEFEEETYKQFDVIYKAFLGDKTLIDNAFNSFKDWEKIRGEVIQLTMDGKKEEAQAITKGKGAKQVELINNTIDELFNFPQNKAEHFHTTAINQGNSSVITVISIQAIVILICIALALFLVKVLKKSTNEIINNLDIFAQGDFTLKIDTQSKDEFGLMKKSLAKAIKNISRMINVIKDKSQNIDNESDNLSATAQEMTSSSQNVSTAIQDVAQGTGTQAEDLVNITSILNIFGESLESIMQTMGNIDSNSKEIQSEANTSSYNMNNLTSSVNKVLIAFENLTTKVSTLSQNINQINEITNVINGIADQRNLLALNEINLKIDDVTSSSVSINDEKNNILEKVEGASAIAEEVSASSEEIAASSEEMTASTEEVASCAQTLSNLTKEMMKQVNKFKL